MLLTSDIADRRTNRLISIGHRQSGALIIGSLLNISFQKNENKIIVYIRKEIKSPSIFTYKCFNQPLFNHTHTITKKNGTFRRNPFKREF